MSSAPLLLFVALLGACSFSGSSPANSDASPDDGGVDAGNTAPCGTPGAMRSRFEPGDERFFFRFGNTDAGPLSFDGTLRFSTGLFEDAVSDYGVKMEGRAITAEVIEPVQGGGAARFFGTDSRLNRFGFNITATTINGFVGGSVGAAVSFDLDSHRHLRAREDSGAIILEAAGNDGNFAEIHSAAFDASMPILAGFEVAPIGTTSVVFDNLNATTEPAAWCAPSDFSDSFADGVLDPGWVRIQNGSRCVPPFESPGVANFDQSGGREQTSCVNRAIAGFDLTKGPVSMHAPSISPPAGPSVQWRVLLEARAPGANGFARISYVDGETCTDGDGPDAPANSLDTCRAYEGASGDHDHFRIRMPTAETIEFEVSPDGDVWTLLHQGPAPFDMRHVNLRIGTSSGYLKNNKSFLIVDYN